MQKIFVTGGAGFIGSRLVKKLLNLGHNITVFDNLSSSSMSRINEILDKITFIKGDILDYELLSNSMAGHDYVFHLAAQLEITKSYEDPVHDLRVNVIGTINVIKACVENKIKKLINSSSACVYGQTDGSSSKETDPTNPNWEYGVSKLAAEKYCQIAQEKHGLVSTSLRYSIVYGPDEWYGRVLTIFIKRALNNQSLVIFGDGTQQRDFVYVDDVVDFNILCLDERTNNQIYNVSSGEGTSVNKLAKIIREKLNVGMVYESVKQGELSTLVPGRVRLAQELQNLILDNKKAKELGWDTKTDLDTGINNLIEWAKKKQSEWSYMKC